MQRVHQPDGHCCERFMLDLDEIARAGAKRMLAEALEAEVESYLEAARNERAMTTDAPWSRETVMPESERSSAELERWR